MAGNICQALPRGVHGEIRNLRGDGGVVGNRDGHRGLAGAPRE